MSAVTRSSSWLLGFNLLPKVTCAETHKIVVCKRVRAMEWYDELDIGARAHRGEGDGSLNDHLHGRDRVQHAFDDGRVRVHERQRLLSGVMRWGARAKESKRVSAIE